MTQNGGLPDSPASPFVLGLPEAFHCGEETQAFILEAGKMW